MGSNREGEYGEQEGRRIWGAGGQESRGVRGRRWSKRSKKPREQEPFT